MGSCIKRCRPLCRGHSIRRWQTYCCRRRLLRGQTYLVAMFQQFVLVSICTFVTLECSATGRCSVRDRRNLRRRTWNRRKERQCGRCEEVGGCRRLGRQTRSFGPSQSKIDRWSTVLSSVSTHRRNTARPWKQLLVPQISIMAYHQSDRSCSIYSFWRYTGTDHSISHHHQSQRTSICCHLRRCIRDPFVEWKSAPLSEPWPILWLTSVWSTALDTIQRLLLLHWQRHH